MASHTLDKMASTELASSLSMEQTDEQRWDWATQWSLPPAETLSLAVPDFHGASSRSTDHPYWGRLGRTPGWPAAGGWRDFKLNGFAVGLVVPLLLVFLVVELRRGSWARGDRRRATASLVLAGLALALAWGRHFLAYRLFFALPLLDTIRNPEKWLGPMSLFLALAVAFAVDRLLERRLELGPAIGRSLGATILLLGVACLFALGWLPGLDGAARAAAADASEAAVLWSLASVAALWLGWRWIGRRDANRGDAKRGDANRRDATRWDTALAALLAITIGGPLVLAVVPYVETTDPTYLETPTPLVEHLDALEPPGRLKLLPPREPVLNGWRLTYLASRGEPLFDPVSVRSMPAAEQRVFATLGPREVEFWRLAGVRWFFATPEMVAELRAASPSFVIRQTQSATAWDPQLEATERVHDGDLLPAISLVELVDAQPMVRLVREWSNVADTPRGDTVALGTFSDPSFDLASAALVHGAPSPAAVGVVPEAASQVRVFERGPTHLVVETVGGGGMLLRATRHDPRWQVTLDDEPAELLRANILFQAVAVPPGNHRVRFEFAPPQGLFVVSIFLRLAWSGALLVWLRRSSDSGDPEPTQSPIQAGAA